MEAAEKCALCNQPLDTTPNVILGEKGCASINKASEERKDIVYCVPGQLVHQECRRQYCKPEQIAKSLRVKETPAQADTVSDGKHVLRSTQKQFNFGTDCFFCGKPAFFDKKRKTSEDVSTVKTVETKDTILAICHKRGDVWANTVQARILSVHDLHAADAVYHRKCSINFRTMKCIPMAHEQEGNASKKAKMGRPPEKQQADAFLETARFLEENDDEQTTIYDLIEHMEKTLGDSELGAYSYRYMQQKLKEHFGDKIIQTEINGKKNVITFRNKAKTILHEHYSHRDTDSEKEKMRVVETAAKLIRDDIRAVKTSNLVYPGCDELGSEESINFLPQSLKLLLTGLIVGKKNQTKVASIGQAIMQAARPRVLLAPLQVGLGVQLHHQYASRFLIDTLHQHGFCCSYNEVHQYEQNAALNCGTDIPNYSSQFIQYVADNVDHNIKTLDGNDTFHGMGMIATITPGIKKSTPLCRAKVSPSEIACIGRVPILYHKEDGLGMTKLKYEQLNSFIAKDSTSQIDLLWKCSILFGSPRPAWSGMMQLVHHGAHPGASSVMFLPMIDINPSDSTCVYSTLKYIQEHSHRYNVTPIITFDQPLWWKALMIISSEPVGSELKNIVLRLGGFHTEMSFLGCIGHLMAASGLQEALEQVYAQNAVVHMLNGKAIARALRGHFIVDAALNALILASTFDINLPEITTDEREGVVGILQTHDSIDNADLKEAVILYENLIQGSLTVEDVCKSATISRIDDVFQSKKQSLKISRTAALWLQYMDMIDILRKHIRAERTGNWNLHLQAVSEMLPYMATSGHNNYTKSLHLYLQQMSNLQNNHPEVYRHFQDGLHVIRRSDRYWAGLSSDLVIEQVLMRSMKTNGGLTRGRGMGEQQRLVWLLSMPACAEVNRTMQELTGVSYDSGEQNKEMTQARLTHDWKDTQKIRECLQERDPFSVLDTSLRSIYSGVHAQSAVNVDNAREVGNSILERMKGVTIADYTFKRSHQVVTLDSKSVLKIEGATIQIDPQLLFQRLIIAAKMTNSIENVFKYELCSYPPALFDSMQMLRQPQKTALANAIWSELSHVSLEIPKEVQFVLDGGSLLQRIPWTQGKTYGEICTAYTDYVAKKYGEAIVVFDGYETLSTKDMAHKRRSKGRSGVSVSFKNSIKLSTRKETFLANSTNKQQFIHMLGSHLERVKCKVYHSPGDADVMIVQKAVQSAMVTDTVLVGDDTDLLVLLCYHASMESHTIFLKPEPKKASKNPRVWNISAVKQELGPEVCSNILFLHAVLGCDTTSQLYGIGKGASLKKFRASKYFQEQAKLFCATSATQKDIIAAGEQALVVLYGGKPRETLDCLRYKLFCEKVATNVTFIHPQTLPPTSAAAKYHSCRVYLQIQEWRGHGNKFQPLEWGWKECDGTLMPLLTDLPPAPDDLLKMIRCNCQTDCSTMRCMCKKYV